MSMEEQQRKALRWLRQARGNLEASLALSAASKHARAVLFAQQTGKGALEAVRRAQDADPLEETG